MATPRFVLLESGNTLSQWVFRDMISYAVILDNVTDVGESVVEKSHKALPDGQSLLVITYSVVILKEVNRQ